MSICISCRLTALRQTLRQHRRSCSSRAIAHVAALSTKSSPPTASSSSSSSSAQAILSKPTWSISSLLSSSSSSPPQSPTTSDRATPTPSTETVTPSQLHHLLRLSALPLPKSPSEEQSMITTLQSQLRFAHAVQRVSTRGVEPLRAIRDETPAALRENTIGLDDLKGVLAGEALVGHYRRPARVREKTASAAEDWNALATASRKAGKYFVVESGKKTTAEPGGGES